MMSWYEAIMALSSFLGTQNGSDFLLRVADRSQNVCKSEPRKFLQNDNKYMHRMPGWHHQTFILLSHFCNEAIGYLANRGELPS
jgi:hypothetical protein